MTTNPIESLVKLLDSPWKPVSSGREYNVQICPYCGNENWHFYVNASDGRFNCKKVQCGARGGIYDLQKLTRKAVPVERAAPPPVRQLHSNLEFDVEVWHQNLWDNQGALDYLIKTRHFTSKAIMHFKIGIMNEYGKDWLIFPHFHNGKVVTLKYRRLDYKQWRHLSGVQIDLYNRNALNSGTEIIITEGEPDCVALWSHGFKNVVSVPGAGNWQPEWKDAFINFKKIYICFDQDDAGKLGAKEIAKKFGYDRCFNVQLPIGIKDVNDFFIHSTGGIKKFGRMLKRARLVDVPYVIKAADSVRDLILKHRVTGSTELIKTPWDQLNNIITGIVPESLVLLTAHPGVGKSTFGLQWMYHLSKEGRPTGYVCIEMSSLEMTQRLLNLHTKLPEQTPEQRIDALEDIGTYPFYWIDLAKHGSVRFDILAETLRDAVPRYDLKIIVVDHFHFMIRSLKYVTEETGKLAQSFKLLARELGIPIVCIAHAIKPVLLATGAPKRLIGSNLRDSGLLYGDSDYIFVMHRKPILSVNNEWEGDWEDSVEISVFKSRHSGKGVAKNLTFYGSLGIIE